MYRGSASGLKILSQSNAIKIDTSSYGLPEYIRRIGMFGELPVGYAYSIITWLLGFTAGADVGKIEALATYGKPDDNLLSQFHSKAKVNGDQINIDQDRFLDIFHNPVSHEHLRALPGENLSATTQRFLEDIYLNLAKRVTEQD